MYARILGFLKGCFVEYIGAVALSLFVGLRLGNPGFPTRVSVRRPCQQIPRKLAQEASSQRLELADNLRRHQRCDDLRGGYTPQFSKGCAKSGRF